MCTDAQEPTWSSCVHTEIWEPSSWNSWQTSLHMSHFKISTPCPNQDYILLKINTSCVVWTLICDTKYHYPSVRHAFQELYQKVHDKSFLSQMLVIQLKCYKKWHYSIITYPSCFYLALLSKWAKNLHTT